MARVFLSLGSNLGDRRRYLDEALRHLAGQTALRVIACSRVYETEPWPEERVSRERWFLNCAVEVETDLSPHRLLAVLQAIEVGAGRRHEPAAPGAGVAPRTLDIDILLYDDQVLSDQQLQIPHLFLHERRFVLTPLAEIAADVEHPTLYRSIRELLAESEDRGGIFPY